MRRYQTGSLIFVVLLVFVLLHFSGKPTEHNTTYVTDNHQILEAYRKKVSDIVVTGEGTVKKILTDDLKGSRHQRFIVELEKRLTLLIAHNIDIAPRVEHLSPGDRIIFRGEYEWNKLGGVVHWTHHDPAAKHINGWLQYNNRLYQ